MLAGKLWSWPQTPWKTRCISYRQHQGCISYRTLCRRGDEHAMSASLSSVSNSRKVGQPGRPSQGHPQNVYCVAGMYKHIFAHHVTGRPACERTLVHAVCPASKWAASTCADGNPFSMLCAGCRTKNTACSASSTPSRTRTASCTKCRQAAAPPALDAQAETRKRAI